MIKVTCESCKSTFEFIQFYFTDCMSRNCLSNKKQQILNAPKYAIPYKHSTTFTFQLEILGCILRSALDSVQLVSQWNEFVYNLSCDYVTDVVVAHYLPGECLCDRENTHKSIRSIQMYNWALDWELWLNCSSFAKAALANQMQIIIIFMWPIDVVVVSSFKRII